MLTPTQVLLRMCRVGVVQEVRIREGGVDGSADGESTLVDGEVRAVRRENGGAFLVFDSDEEESSGDFVWVHSEILAAHLARS